MILFSFRRSRSQLYYFYPPLPVTLLCEFHDVRVAGRYNIRVINLLRGKNQ